MSGDAPLSSVAMACLGAVSGIIEVAINQPTVSWKNALQQGKSISFDPRVMYRGLLINSLSIAPITAVQFGVTGLASNAFLSVRGAKPGDEPQKAERLASAAIAGAASGLLSCPAEMIIMHQQKTGLGIVGQFKQLVNQYGARSLYRGVVSTVSRECVFTAGYMGLAPVVRELLYQHASQHFGHSDDNNPNALRAKIVSSLVGGITAGIVSHPIDTIKVCGLHSDPRSSLTRRIPLLLPRRQRSKAIALLLTHTQTFEPLLD